MTKRAELMDYIATDKASKTFEAIKEKGGNLTEIETTYNKWKKESEELMSKKEVRSDAMCELRDKELSEMTDKLIKLINELFV